MFDNSLINPAALFEVSVPIHRLPEVLDMRSPETWGLDDKYQIPAIHVLNSQNSRRTSIRCGWNEQGLFLACRLTHKIPSGSQSPYTLKLELAVHTRYSRDLRARDDFSTHLVFDLRGPKFVDRIEVECQETTQAAFNRFPPQTQGATPTPQALTLPHTVVSMNLCFGSAFAQSNSANFAPQSFQISHSDYSQQNHPRDSLA